MNISQKDARLMYEQVFGAVGSAAYAQLVINKLYAEWARLFNNEDPPKDLFTLHQAVNEQLDVERDHPRHTVGHVMCDQCYGDVYSYCTMCVGPHGLGGVTRHNANATDQCDECQAENMVRTLQ